MKFYEFIESTYVSTNIQNQLGYSPHLAAQAQAAQNLLNGQRNALRWIAYPVLLGSFLLVKLGIRPAPLSPEALVKAFTEKNAAPQVTAPASS